MAEMKKFDKYKDSPFGEWGEDSLIKFRFIDETYDYDEPNYGDYYYPAGTPIPKVGDVIHMPNFPLSIGEVINVDLVYFANGVRVDITFRK